MTTKETNRPYIVVDIVDMGYSRVFIRCRNLGHSIATNIKITLDNTFIEQIKIAKVKESIESINNTAPFVLEPSGEKVWEVFLIPRKQLDFFHHVHGENAKYKANVLECNLSYNGEYFENFEIDYNNLLDGISADKRLSNDLFSITMGISHIQDKLDGIKTAINGLDQDKKTHRD